MKRPFNSMMGREKRRLREQLSEAQNHRCAYCGADVRTGATMEHVIPRARGGRCVWANLVIACRGCNMERRARDAMAFWHARNAPRPPKISTAMEAIYQRAKALNAVGALQQGGPP